MAPGSGSREGVEQGGRLATRRAGAVGMGVFQTHQKAAECMLWAVYSSGL